MLAAAIEIAEQCARDGSACRISQLRMSFDGKEDEGQADQVPVARSSRESCNDSESKESVETHSGTMSIG